MLRTKLPHTHPQLAHQRFLFTPVAVCRVENLGLGNHGDSEELAIRRIELVYRKLIVSPALIRARCDWNHTTDVPPCM